MQTRFYIVLIILTSLCASSISAAAQERKKSISGKRYQSYKDLDVSSSNLLDEARTIKSSDPTSALDKVQEALGVAIANGDLGSEAQCYILLGEINEGIAEWKLALQNFSSAYEILKSSGSLSGEAVSSNAADATRGIGNANLKLGKYAQALDYFNLAYDFSITPLARAERQIDLSEVYYQMGNYSKAIDVLDRIGRSKIEEKNLELRIQNQRTKIYAKTNQVEKALDAYQNSQNTLRSATTPSEKQDVQLLNDTKEEVASTLHEQQKYDDEIIFRNSAVQYNMQSDNLPEVTVDKIGLGKAFAAKGETNAAIREFEEAVKIADTLNNPRDKAQAFLALATIYDNKKQSDQALSAYRHYSEAVKEHEVQTETRLAERESLLKKQRDIEELSKDVSIGRKEEILTRETVFTQKIIIYGLLLIIVIVVVTSYFIFKNAQASKTANQLLALKSLRSQMNPHFIFNALNSVNHFIAQNDERTANKFLSEFSRLMRLVLENSQLDFISLANEHEIISLYLKLEHYRFRDKFEYEINIEEGINLEAIEIPPMLIQPYIENAVWHGLRYKETKGQLLLKITRSNDDLEIKIEDDGIGRKRSAELKTENQKRQHSTGLKNIQERLRIINKVYKTNYSIAISDLHGDQSGTKVEIYLPAKKQKAQL